MYSLNPTLGRIVAQTQQASSRDSATGPSGMCRLSAPMRLNPTIGRLSGPANFTLNLTGTTYNGTVNVTVPYEDTSDPSRKSTLTPVACSFPGM